LDKFVIEGPCRLKGRVIVSGAKNAVLPLMAAALLTRGRCVIENVPDLRDVRTMIELLRILGAEVELQDGTLTIDSSKAEGTEAPYDLVKTMRASVYVLGPLLASRGKARVSLPGGCAWGPRPVDLHLMAMEQLGAKLRLRHGYIEATARKLRGAEIVFPISSVGATANALMAASLARGRTVIKNAALEPEVAELARALAKAGVGVEGIGSRTLIVEGAESLSPFQHRVIPDRIEAGTMVAAAVATGGQVEVAACEPDHLESVLDAFRLCGAEVEVGDGTVAVEGPRKIKATHVVTREYPGFPTDMQAQMMSVLCLADGVSTIKETIFPDRFTHVPELRRLGADVRIDGNLAVITGVDSFEGAPVMATDIRASSALVIAALVANGTTEISRIYHIDRGYERLEEKLAALGARIRRVSE